MSLEGLDAFNQGLADFTAASLEEFDTLKRFLALEGLQRIVLDTPVDTGRLRANWQTTAQAPATNIIDGVDPSGRAAIAGGRRVIESTPRFDSIFIANSMPYAEVVESGGYVPADPENSPEANKKRARRRNKAQRREARARDAKDRGLASTSGADDGVPFVRGGYSIKAPQGMVGKTFEALRAAVPTS